MYSKENTLDNVTILCVDDNSNMLSIIKTMLNGLGCRSIFMATDAAEAFEIFCEQPIDLIITDYVLPTLDGVEFSQIVRTANDSPNKKVPIIMLTAYSERYRVETSRDAGINEYLQKPVSIRDLYDRIIVCLYNSRQFIEASTYVGPDRRRMQSPNYTGTLKRSTDPKKEEVEIDDFEKVKV